MGPPWMPIRPLARPSSRRRRQQRTTQPSRQTLLRQRYVRGLIELEVRLDDRASDARFSQSCLLQSPAPRRPHPRSRLRYLRRFTPRLLHHCGMRPPRSSPYVEPEAVFNARTVLTRPRERRPNTPPRSPRSPDSRRRSRARPRLCPERRCGPREQRTRRARRSHERRHWRSI